MLLLEFPAADSHLLILRSARRCACVGDVNRSQLFAVLIGSMPYIFSIYPQGNTPDARRVQASLRNPYRRGRHGKRWVLCRWLAYICRRHSISNIIPYWHLEAKSAFVGGCKGDHLTIVCIKNRLGPGLVYVGLLGSGCRHTAPRMLGQ